MAPTVVLEHAQKTQSKKVFCDRMAEMMGKTQKFSRGYSSGFVPESRHAVEIVEESEGGFGSSGRVDPEGSEYSCAPKRKCISLNGNKCGNFNVPMQVISVLKMSVVEREDMERRLRSELEQVRTLQNKIVARFTNGIALSSTSEVKPEVKKTRVPEKKAGQTGKNWTHSKLKRGHSGRFESVGRPAPPTGTADTMLMKQCDSLLRMLMAHEFGWAFNSPVDVVKLNIPDYFTIIKHPMDLGTIKRKISSGAYSSRSGFLADVRLTFTNAKTYNPPGNDFHIMADTLSKFFEVRWKPIEKKLRLADHQFGNVKSGAIVEAGATVVKQGQLPSKKRKTLPASTGKVAPAVSGQRKMTKEDIDRLRSDLESLEETPYSLLQFLGVDGQNGLEESAEIEVDIESFSDEKYFELRRLLDDIMRERKKKEQAMAEPCELEILNESGVSNSSMLPCKGNEPADEDVDIVGNDPPISSYPPVEIEKDTARRSSKCSSSSSSSSDSGSSSSGLISWSEQIDLNTNIGTDPVELDNRQEEKNRLQTETKATENVIRQAEAAAEAKWKYELERETARQALFKIERTVEINMNCWFSKDLEMLRAAPAGRS
ncbi:Transcription factor GTE10 [Acorus gramineus]|uniref:Transcription factor GTE10 n=1 Tax=Acorus gramineus TaxID=55184 RepID=A0AAV9B2S8_ACOGR|nr:Transcription factor GTE10 [Acorus gramineus]